MADYMSCLVSGLGGFGVDGQDVTLYLSSSARATKFFD